MLPVLITAAKLNEYIAPGQKQSAFYLIQDAPNNDAKTQWLWDHIWDYSASLKCGNGESPLIKFPLQSPYIWGLPPSFSAKFSDGKYQKPVIVCDDATFPASNAASSEKLALIWVEGNDWWATGEVAPMLRLWKIDGVHYDSKRFGEIDTCERVAIFNNTIVDVGKSAILRSEQGNATASRTLRDVLIFNNIILGQRLDPAAKFDTYFGSGTANFPLPLEPATWVQLNEPATRALVDINVPRLYDGFAGIRLFSNAIGRRFGDAWSVSDEKWTSPYILDGGPGNILQLLKYMATQFFDSLPDLKPPLAQSLELPH